MPDRYLWCVTAWWSGRQTPSVYGPFTMRIEAVRWHELIRDEAGVTDVRICLMQQLAKAPGHDGRPTPSTRG